MQIDISTYPGESIMDGSSLCSEFFVPGAFVSGTALWLASHWHAPVCYGWAIVSVQEAAWKLDGLADKCEKLDLLKRHQAVRKTIVRVCKSVLERGKIPWKTFVRGIQWTCELLANFADFWQNNTQTAVVGLHSTSMWLNCRFRWATICQESTWMKKNIISWNSEVHLLIQALMECEASHWRLWAL